MKVYDTVTEAIEGLRKEGFNKDYNIAFNQINCTQDGTCLNPSQFEIVQTHRFDGMTNPEDDEVVYAIQSLDGNHKGVIMSGYGTYAEEISPEMIEKLRYTPDAP